MTSSVFVPPVVRLTDAAARVAARLGAAGRGAAGFGGDGLEPPAGDAGSAVGGDAGSAMGGDAGPAPAGDAAAAPAGDAGWVIARLDDAGLLGLLADATEARKALELIVAAGSVEVARRSARDLGYGGLAQRNGLRTGTALVQQITGLGRTDVTRAVAAGEELAPAPAPAPAPGPGPGQPDQPAPPALPAPVTPGWLGVLRGALGSGRVSQAQFHAIRTGLGDPPVDRYPDLDPTFLPDAWAHAVGILLQEAAERTVEDLRDQARIARDRLDPVGVTLRFEERFAARSFRRWTDQTGQQHARISFDDDAAAWVDTILRAALRPRRGPRFVGADATAKTAAAEADERSNEQLQYDTLLAILRTGANADPQQAFGDRQPGIRILLEAGAITAAGNQGSIRVTGVGHLEDGGQALPPGIVEKYLCDAGTIPIIRDDTGRPLDLGREQRLFNRKQRIAIGTRHGGCITPGCERPLSECEYHHNDHWWEHHGNTNVDDGVPLCRNCHMRVHNHGLRITRQRDPDTGTDTYWLHYPPDPDTGDIRPPAPLRTKSPTRFTAA